MTLAELVEYDAATQADRDRRLAIVDLELCGLPLSNTPAADATEVRGTGTRALISASLPT